MSQKTHFLKYMFILFLLYTVGFASVGKEREQRKLLGQRPFTLIGHSLFLVLPGKCGLQSMQTEEAMSRTMAMFLPSNHTEGRRRKHTTLAMWRGRGFVIKGWYMNENEKLITFSHTCVHTYAASGKTPGLCKICLFFFFFLQTDFLICIC